MRNTAPLCAALLATALAACAGVPAAPTPGAAALPAAYPHAAANPAARPSAGSWWTVFGDERLDRLVDQVLARNNDLAAAAILVRKAQIEAGIAADALNPQASGDASASISQTARRVTSRTAAASVSVAYETDLFGKLGAERDAARWEARATEQDRQSTALSLTGTTVKLYWELAYVNERIAMGEDAIAYSRKVLALVQAQHAAGAVSAIEVAEAEQDVHSQEVTQSQLVQERVEARSSLALLLGGRPWPQDDEPQALPEGPAPAIAPGAPAELLARRPDLRAAELRLRESLADVASARASFYPQITLTGEGGGSSAQLSQVLANPAATLGVDVTLPFLGFNQLRLKLKGSEADYDKAAVDFRQSLLTAFKDVDDALSSTSELARQSDRQAATLAAAARASDLYRLRYRTGAVALRTWLDAQQSQRADRETLAQTRLSLFQAHVTLYQALGGGLTAHGG
jgi:NodT family efflux transporter outer membrane factor (OMF) lipoprotein